MVANLYLIPSFILYLLINSRLSFLIISMDLWVPIIFSGFQPIMVTVLILIVPALASRRSFRLTPVSTPFCEHFSRFWLSHDVPGSSCTNLESAISPQGFPRAGDDIENPRSGQRYAL